MSKVRIVSKIKERQRVTSFGVIEFDQEGISIEKIDEEVARAIVGVSTSMFIEGEELLKPKASGTVVVETEDSTGTEKTTYTRKEVEVELASQGDRLVKEISKSLGLSEEFVGEQMLSPSYPEEENMLIPVSTYNELVSDLKSKKDLHLVEDNIQGEESKETTKDIVPEGDEVELDTVVSEEEITLKKKELRELSIQKLREIAEEMEIPTEEWAHLKGLEGKEKLVEVILSKL